MMSSARNTAWSSLSVWTASCVLSAGLFVTLSPTPATSARGDGSKMEVLPVEKAAPKPVVLEAGGPEQELRRQLRAKTGVAPLSAPHLRFSEAPVGSFGFIPAQALSMALVMRSPDLVIEQVAATPTAYEIHKVEDGGGLLVGFVGQDLVPQLTADQRLHTINLTLHSNPSENAPLIAAVPLIKLVADRMPTRLDPKRPDSVMMLTVDLQGTANRKKSLHGGQ